MRSNSVAAATAPRLAPPQACSARRAHRRHRSRLVRRDAGAALVLALAACSPLQERATPAPPGVRLDDAGVRCAAMSAANVSDGRITQAQWVGDGTQRVVDPASMKPVGDALPEHCLLRGRLDERIGTDGEPYHTGFELRLPSHFSGRLLFQGGDDLGGVLQMAVGRNSGAAGWADNALQRGFAAVSTDGGHQLPTPLFGLDPQARIEQAWRAHWRTAVTARSLVERYYGSAAHRSYFVGCSEGGRQGLMFAQRFPELFDGIVAVAPAMRISEGAAIAAAWTVQSLLAVAPPGPDGRPMLAQALSELQLRRVAREIVERCDAADGIEDGIVADTALCRIDPLRLQCPVAGDGCLTAAQARALGRVLAGPRSRSGARLYFGFPWDPGIAHPGWRTWTLGQAVQGAPDARHATRVSGALGFVFATPPDPTLTTSNFDFDRDPMRLLDYHRLYGTADDVQLRGFVARGGRLLLVHGMADPLFSAFETADFQERANLVHGQVAASRFMRTFLVPGMNHCAGGPATDAFDALGSIVAWVEERRAPQRIVARGSAALPGLSRPLCPYPKIARYLGQGDPASAESFECR